MFERSTRCLVGAVAAVAAAQCAHAENAVNQAQIKEVVVRGKRAVAAQTAKTALKKDLQQGAATLGDALEHRIGVHSNQFGSGASAPVIRGHETYRIKILQNGSEVTDMSRLSPDHAIMVSPVSADKIEVLQGVETLLYDSGATGGAVNVQDRRIPETIPDQTVGGDINLRFNSAGKEKLGSAAFDFALGESFALHLEGEKRKSDDYRTRRFTETGLKNVADELSDEEWDQRLERKDQGDQMAFWDPVYKHYNHVRNSKSESAQGSIGLSWIGEKGYLGASFTRRKDDYGLPGHDDKYHNCKTDNATNFQSGDYLYRSDGVVLGCSFNKHIHDGTTATAHKHDPNALAHIDLDMKRYEVKGAWNDPFAGIKQIRLSADRTRYSHDEKEDAWVGSTFTNNSDNVRLEFEQKPRGIWSGVFGAQYGKTRMSATGEEGLLDGTNERRYAVFGLQKFDSGRLKFQLAARAGHRKIDTADNRFQEKWLPLRSIRRSDNDYSFGGSAQWQINDAARLDFSYTRQERVPSAQELYARGTHAATSTYELGDEQYDRLIEDYTQPEYLHLRGDRVKFLKYGIEQPLDKEKSHNFDLGFNWQSPKFRLYSGVYYKRYANYLYAYTMDRYYDFRLIRHAQGKAEFYGAEAEAAYRVHPKAEISIFGDYIRGKMQAVQGNGNVPRIPAARLGSKLTFNITPKLSASAEYVRSFKQKNTADYEDQTPSFGVANMSVEYKGKKGATYYRVYLNGNNLFNQAVYSHSTFLPHIPKAGRNFTAGVNIMF